MKRLIVSVILLIMMITAGTADLIYTEHSCSQTINQAKAVKQALYTDNYEKAADDTKKLEIYWEEKVPYLSIFIRHENLEEISSQISVVSGCISQNNIYGAYLSLDRIISDLDSIKNDENPFVLSSF